jgi:hypothetical protein
MRTLIAALANITESHIRVTKALKIRALLDFNKTPWETARVRCVTA